MKEKKEKKIEAVVPSVTLNRLVERWNQPPRRGSRSKVQGKSNEGWLRLCKFVRDSKVTRGQIHWALVKIRGMKESSAGVVASRLLKFQKDPEASKLLDRALAGEDITVHELRVGGVSSDPGQAIKARLSMAARSALEGSMKYDLFVDEAGAAYVRARSRAERLANRKKEHIVIDDNEALLPVS